MRHLAQFTLAGSLLFGAAGGLLVWDQGVHVPVPGITRPTAIVRVVEVLSGDTLDISIDNERRRLVLTSIDAPRTQTLDGAADCLGEESRDHLRELLPNGQRFYLRAVNVQDDGTVTATAHTVLAHVEREMVAAGLASPSAAAHDADHTAPSPAQGALARIPLLSARPFAAGFTERVELERQVDDARTLIAATAVAQEKEVGFFDPAAECTIPAQLNQLRERISAAGMLPHATAELPGVDIAARVVQLDQVQHDLEGFAHAVRDGAPEFPLRAYHGAPGDDQPRVAELGHAVDVEFARIEAAREALARAQRTAEELRAEEAVRQAEEASRAAQRQRQEDAQRENRWQRGGHDDSPDEEGGGPGPQSTAPQQRPPAQNVPPEPWVLPGDPAADTSGLEGVTYDGYTGCRAYSGFPPDALDEMGRPFRKVDCTTRQPLN